MALSDYRIIAPLAYIGKEGCRDVRCTQMPGEDGCRGYHCSYCDQPCGCQGHGCDAAKTLIAATEREASNQDSRP